MAAKVQIKDRVQWLYIYDDKGTIQCNHMENCRIDTEFHPPVVTYGEAGKGDPKINFKQNRNLQRAYKS